MSKVCQDLNDQGYLTFLDTSIHDAKNFYIKTTNISLVVSNCDEGRKNESLFIGLIPDERETNLNYIITINNKIYRMVCNNRMIKILDSQIEKVQLKEYKLVIKPLAPIINSEVNLVVNDEPIKEKSTINLLDIANIAVSSTKTKIDEFTDAFTISLNQIDSSTSLNTKTIKVKVRKPGIEDYTWEEINAIAKEVSNDNNINYKSTNSVEKVINGKKYYIDVGDTKKVTIDDLKYTVRVIGFNHDDLTYDDSYGEVTKTNKAGISFEFVTSLFDSPVYDSSRYSANWKDCSINKRLNTDTIEKLTEFKSIIKSVNKKYISKHGDENSVKTDSNKLWLLACSEIWSDNGWAVTKEGEQYKYYEGISSSSVSNNLVQKKDVNGKSKKWILRSPSEKCAYGDYFCSVESNMCMHAYICSSIGIIPGFSI